MTNFFEECVADIKGAIPGDWESSSYGNDACPSYETPTGWQIFIDHGDPVKREIQDDEWKRFHIIVAENYGNGLGIDTPQLNTDSFQEVLKFVSEAAPKYREREDGKFEEILTDETLIERPQKIFRVEWEPEAYGNAPPRHVTWEELENDDQWNGILEEDVGAETVGYRLHHLNFGEDFVYHDPSGEVHFFRMDSEAERLAIDAWLLNRGKVSDLVEYTVRRKQNYYEEKKILALSEDEAIDRLRHHLDDGDDMDRKYVDDDGLVTADCLQPNLLRIRTGRSG